MGILRVFGSLNCFGSAQRRPKSRRNMVKELSNMHETINHLQQDIETTRRVVELYKQRQRAEEEQQEKRRNTRAHLMARVQHIESRLGRVLEKRQIIETLRAMEKKAIFFRNDLNDPAEDPEKDADKWKPGKLRRVRALNDLNKAEPQTSLCPSQELVKDDGDDALMDILTHENYEESLIITEPFF